MGLFEAAKPKSYLILDKPLHCQVCGHDEFWKRDIQLNTAAMEILNMGWANQSAMGFVCDKCGFVHLFVRK